MQHMPEYKNQVDLVTWHIPSAHSKEMATQSDVVCIHIQYICIILLAIMFN